MRQTNLWNLFSKKKNKDALHPGAGGGGRGAGYSLANTGRLLPKGLGYHFRASGISKAREFKFEENERIKNLPIKNFQGLKLCLETICLFAISFSGIMFIKRYFENDMQTSCTFWRFFY